MLILLALMATMPPRATGLDVQSAQSLSSIQQCIEHRAGNMTEDEEIDHGVMITLGSSTNMLGMHRTGPLTFQIVDAGEVRHITVMYRHPLSEKAAAMNLREMGRKCFPYELSASGLGMSASGAK